MKVYLSAQFPRANEMCLYAVALATRSPGQFTVTSTWHTVPAPGDADLTDDERQRMAHLDIDDLERADVLVIFGDDPGAYGGSGGKFVELGYALGIGLPVVWVGPCAGVFPWHRDVIRCDTWADAVDVLTHWQEQRGGLMATTDIAVTVTQLDAVQKQVGEWGVATFPNATPTSITAHLQEETDELESLCTPQPPEGMAESSEIAKEAADCLLLLLHVAHREGFSLMDAALAKFAINQGRTWAPTPDGRYSKHVEAS